MKPSMIAAFTLLGGLLLAEPGLRPQPGPRAPVTKIGVVDFNAVKNRSKKIAAIFEKANKDIQSFSADLERLKKKAKELEDSLVMFEKGSKEAIQAIRNLNVARYEIEQTVAARNTYIRKTRSEILYEVYGMIQEKIRLLAEKKGLTLVLKVERESPEEKKLLQLRQRLEILQNNDVLYHTKAVDLTDEVVQLLDA